MSDPDVMRARAELVLGYAGRMMSYSKSGYREQRPTNVCAFNSRIAAETSEQQIENIWWGDLDLTLWEQRLAVLARLLDQRLFLLYEADSLDRYETEPVERALAIIDRDGTVMIGARAEGYVARSRDGTLRMHLPVPSQDRRLRWRVLVHRPRLWRFWNVELVRQPQGRDRRRTTLLYIGARDDGSPLLAIRASRERNALDQIRTVEWTWYPANGANRRAAKHLLRLNLWMPLPFRAQAWLRVVIWPAMSYEIYGGLRRECLDEVLR